MVGGAQYWSWKQVADTQTPGPVAEKAKEQAAKTGSDFQGLADSRAPPSQPAADGQPLTREFKGVLIRIDTDAYRLPFPLLQLAECMLHLHSIHGFSL